MNAKDITDAFGSIYSRLVEYRKEHGDHDYKIEALEVDVSRMRQSLIDQVLRQTEIVAPKMVTPKIK